MNRSLSKISMWICTISMISTFANANVINVSAEDKSYSTEFNINLNGEKKEISPYIYGVNQHSNLDEVSATVVRQGGNRFTTYNWETNYSNAGSDWKNSSDTYLSISSIPGACAIKLSEECQEHNIDYKFTTLQMAGYVAADTNGSVLEDEIAPSNRWNKVKNRKNGILSLTPDLDDGIVYMDEYVNYLVQTLGDATTSTGIQGYSLDNEPALWHSTHPLIHQDPVGMQELVAKSIDLAKVVKEIDPNADVFGPALWGYLSCRKLADSDESDEWEIIQSQGDYNWFIDYYLDEMKKASDEYGTRLIDYLDFHYYAQATNTVEDILQGVRTLYDDNFVENSWIGSQKQWHPTDLPILPNIKNAIDSYFPDTKISISEYNFHCGEGIVGAIVEAEALGCFADNGIYLATIWDCDDNTDYTYSGINLYTNYDGNGSSFGNILVETSIEDNSKSNAYASINDNDDSQVNVIITNKDMQNDEIATINLQNSTQKYKNAVVYGIVDGSSDIIVLDKINNIENNSFDVELPSLSVIHIVVSNDINAFDDIEIFDHNIVPTKPTFKEVVLSSNEIKTSENGFYIEVENPENIAKIKFETELIPSDASTWYTVGGGIGLIIDTDTSQNTWAYKSFKANQSDTAVEIEIDGEFKVPNDDGSEEKQGILTGSKIELQPWWSSSEFDGSVAMNLKSVTIYYYDNASNENIIGDINNDGTVNYIDLLLLKKHILGISTPSNDDVVDLNQDGYINVIDIISLKDIILA